jgi:molybdopterin molybdotransferase
MDGYAVKYSDIKKASKDHPIRLLVVEDLPAGSISTKILEKRQAIRIMTGAPIPKGADTVIPVEETKKEGTSVLIYKVLPLGEHIRRAGEDVKKGDRVISIGDLIRPAEVGMLAAIGRSSVFVYQRPLVAILCTGDELVDVDGDLDEVKIISSNSYTLEAQVKDCGAVPIQLGIAKDQKEVIKEKLLQGIRADVLISSAGVSVGDYDFVKDALDDLGMEMIFWKVAMKPGKPLVFGTINGKLVFGLPGNPVPSMISFEQFVRPSLLKMMGHRQIFQPIIEAVLKEDLHKEQGRRHFIPASVSLDKNSYFVTIQGGQGSGRLRSMVRANGLIIIPEDRGIVKAGEKVKVQLLYKSYEIN